MGKAHNRRIRKTQAFLEQTIDPATGEPYLKPVKVRLFGEDPEDAVPLPPYLNDAYDFEGEAIGIYAGGGNSGIIRNGEFKRTSRDEIKQKVGRSELRLLLGTDAASEGLNLQRLGTLINFDLPFLVSWH